MRSSVEQHPSTSHATGDCDKSIDAPSTNREVTFCTILLPSTAFRLGDSIHITFTFSKDRLCKRVQTLVLSEMNFHGPLKVPISNETRTTHTTIETPCTFFSQRTISVHLDMDAHQMKTDLFDLNYSLQFTFELKSGESIEWKLPIHVLPSSCTDHSSKLVVNSKCIPI